MHLSTTNTPSPPQYPFDASKLPNVSILGPCHLPTPQPQPQSSANVQCPTIASNPSCLTAYAPQSLPPFSTSFQAAFPSSAPQPHQSIPHTTAWNPPAVTFLPNEVSAAPLNQPSESPFRLPVVPNIPSIHYQPSQAPSANPSLPPLSAPVTHPPAPTVYASHVCPSHNQVLVRFPAVPSKVAVPPFPIVTLPGTPNSCKPPMSTVALVEAAKAAPPISSAPVAKPRSKRKKQPSAAKRSRTKTTASTTTKDVSTATGAATASVPLPPVRGQRKASSLPSSRTLNKAASRAESIPSPSVLVGPNTTFTTPNTHQPTLGLNFADVVLEKPSYRTESARSRHGPSREGLKAHENATCCPDDATARGTPQMYSEANKAPIDDSTNPQLTTGQSVRVDSQHRPQTYVPSVPSVPRDIKDSPSQTLAANRTSCSGSKVQSKYPGSLRKRGAKPKGSSSSVPTTTMLQGSEKFPSAVDASPTDECRGKTTVGSDHCHASNVINGWNAEAATRKGDTAMQVTDGDVTARGLEASGMNTSARERNYSEEREENAAECLMTLAGSLVPPKFNYRKGQNKDAKEVQSTGAWKAQASDSNIESERQSSKNSKSRNERSLKAVCSFQNCKEKGDSGIQMVDNFGNFLNREWHLQSNANRLPQSNASQFTYSASIPGPSPTSVNETSQPAPSQAPAASVPYGERKVVYAQGTPTDIRETTNLFTRLPTSPLPDVSHNHSLTQEAPVPGQCLTTPQEPRQRVIPHLSHSSSDICTTLQYPSPVARPLFQHGNAVQSTSNPQQHFSISNHHRRQLEHYHTMHQAASLTQSVQQFFPLPASTDLPTLQHHIQSAAIVPTQSSLPRESHEVPDSAFGPESMPKRTKQQTKQRTGRDSSKTAKSSKAKLVRASVKNPKPRRPRQPKGNPLSQPCATDSVPSGHASPTTTTPLRLCASFSKHSAAVPLTTSSLPPSASALHQQAVHETRSIEARVSVNSFHDPSSLPEIHRAPASKVASKPCHLPGRDTALGISEKTKPSNPRPRKTPVSKNSASVEKAVKAANKTAQSRRNSMQQTKEPSVNALPSNRPAQIFKLQPATTREQQHCQNSRLGEPQKRHSPSEQRDECQQDFDFRARTDECSPTCNAVPHDPVSTEMRAAKEAQMGTVFADNLPVSSRTYGDHDASSPRTESTQQTLAPDTSSGGPSETENHIDSHGLALTHKKSLERISSSSAVPNAGVKSVHANGKQQSVVQKTSQQESLLVPTESPATVTVDKSGCATTQLSAVESSATASRKRQTSSKSMGANKKRKKNSASSPQQALSPKDKSALPLKGEDALRSVANSQRESFLEPKKTTPQKKAVKVQTKNKAAQNPTPARKRPSSSAKTQTKEKSKRKGAKNLRLCLSIREKDDESTPQQETKSSGDACGSPVTSDKVRNGSKYSSKSPQRAGSRVGKCSVETDKNGGNLKNQNTPCFAEELKSLHVSGILTTREAVSSPFLSDNLLCGVPNLQKFVCALCQKNESRNGMVKHPCFPVRAFDICKSCSEIVCKRVEEHGAKRKAVAVPSEESLAQRTTLFVMLIEEMVRHFTPSDREHRDVKRIYDFINNRSFTEMAERAESLSVNLDMLTVLRVALRKVGFTMRGGRLRWPAGGFTLPTLADTRALVSHAVPARIEDLRKGILPGEAAWNETFGKDQNLPKQGSSCAIYERVFSLIGLKMIHVTDCSSQDSSTGDCKVRFDTVSMGALMYRTAAMLSGTVMRELLAACWTREEAFQFINETEIKLCQGRYEGTIDSCCICGVSEQLPRESYCFRFSKCAECLKSFCSVCLLNVLGTSEYLRSFGDSEYLCMICRFQKNAELCPTGKPNQGEHDRRLRLHNIAGIRKKSERRIQTIAPLLLLSPSVRADVLLQLESFNSRKSHGIAKFCEVANDNSVRAAMGLQGGQAFHNVCLECKLPAFWEDRDRSEGEVLTCGYDGCINVMHKTCLAPQRQARRRGSRSKWSCPHHQCNKCDQRDESKLLRCRTCPTTFCKDHVPSPSEVYLFSERSFACSACRSFVRVPQLLRLKPNASKSERKRNPFAQALIIDQRKRSAAVRKMAEGSGCCQGASSSFTEFRRELETN